VIALSLSTLLVNNNSLYDSSQFIYTMVKRKDSKRDKKKKTGKINYVLFIV